MLAGIGILKTGLQEGFLMDANHGIAVRDIESRDYLPAAKVWRTALGDPRVTDESFAQIREMMKHDSRYRTFVAETNGNIVGLVTTVEVLAFNLPNGYIQVNGLAVLPEFQHCGIGKTLMERVEELARERNISLIGITSGFQRTGAHEFYEHLGYQKISFWLRKRI